MTAPTTRYVPALDGLRAIAVVLVLLFHSTDRHLLPGGFVGVDVFFVLSGYLITTQLLAARLDLPRFYARRLARLWPALLVVVAVVAVATAGRGGVPLAVPFAATYTLNICFAYGVGTGDASLVSHMWSLAIEVQFYLLWALGMAWLNRRSVSARTLLLITLGVAATSYGIRAVYAVALDDSTRAYFATEARLDALFLGAAVAVCARNYRPALNRLAHPALGLAMLLLVAVTFHFATRPSFLLAVPLAAAATVLLLATVLVGRGQVVAALGSPVPVWLGLRSYSLYLWHFPIFTLLRNHTTLHGPALVLVEWLLALVAAALSYRLVEVPARRKLYARIGRPAQVPLTSSS